MSLLGPILVAIVSIGLLLGFMALVRARAEKAGWSAELQRKLVHIAAGIYAIALPFLFQADWPVFLLLALAMLAMAVMRLPTFRHRGAGAALHGVERQSWGDFLLLAAVGLVFVMSGRDPLLHVLPLAVLTLGDAAAALAGSTYGRRFFAVEDGRKSVEGSVILFLVTMILSMVCLLLLSEIPRSNVVILALLISAFGTLVEADSWHGFDNLFLPLTVLVMLLQYGESSPSTLAMLATAFLAALLVFDALARWGNLSRHMARVYLLAIFLLLSVTTLQNMVLPLAMLALHAFAERRAPTHDATSSLDAVAVLAILCCGWLTIGIAFDANALDFLGMTMAGFCLALAILASAGTAPALRWGMAILLLPNLWALRGSLAALNPPATRWAESAGAVSAATLLLCGLATLLAPGAFQRRRMLRLGTLAFALPAAAYMLLATTTSGGSR